ncbi:DUF1836 domain-containing protein [Bacillus sp. FJAT-42315]|uniref:DUF1836 domain-containing protein n=1 Tax=Bacillus sp. FJAT-42315 TaxID=2014077 RepID=UPI000C237867|nr:DUF1836 domain-containing protein [Bacillus sp. FJAT-42315]
MEKINEIMTKLGLDNQVTLEDIPNIDLYMDQVIQLFENTFSSSKRSEEEKVLTKTMINNYAKGKLFFPIKQKKYSKEHILLISLIYQLKGALSINDIKQTLQGVNEKVENEQLDLDSFYNSYLRLVNQNVEHFRNDIQTQMKAVKQEIEEVDQDLEQVLMIASLVHMSNLYRKVAEKLVDELEVES